MASMARIENALLAAVAASVGPGCPPKLASAVRHAVFPGGARIRPQLCLAVARACGDDHPELADAAAVAIELLHCASLVHDDLPCFDDAPLRRGQASVHCAFGERLAVLAGDALIVMSTQVLVRAAAEVPDRLLRVMQTIGEGVGMPGGIVAGQAWECEPRVTLREYQRLKTGALFTAATVSGAQAAGGDAEAWRALGDCLGEAYQVADDIRDVIANPETCCWAAPAWPPSRVWTPRCASSSAWCKAPSTPCPTAGAPRCCAPWCAPRASAWCRRRCLPSSNCVPWREPRPAPHGPPRQSDAGRSRGRTSRPLARAPG